MAPTIGSRLPLLLLPILISFTALAAGPSDAGGRSGASEPGQAAASADSPEEFRRLVDSGRYPEAETLARRLVKEAEAAHGPESVPAAEAIDCLTEALLLMSKELEPEWRGLSDRAVRIKETLLGPDDPGVAVSLIRQAELLFRAREVEPAVPALERAIAIREKAFGPDHPETARAVSELALWMANMTRYDRARPLAERALAILERAPAAYRLDEARSLLAAGMSALWTEERGWAPARPLFERALAIEEEVLGPEHPSLLLLQTVGQLGLQRHEEGDFLAARRFFERGLHLQEKAPVQSISGLPPILVNLADVVSHFGDLQTSIALIERAASIREKAYGPGNLAAAWTLAVAAEFYVEEGDVARARAIYENTLRVIEKGAPANFSALGPILNYSGLLVDMGELGEAKAVAERALAIAEKYQLKESGILAGPFAALGSVMMETGDLSGARAQFERAIHVLETRYGADHPLTTQALAGDYTALLRRMGEYDRARENFAKLLAIEEKEYGPESPRLVRDLATYADLIRESGDAAGARPHIERALGLLEGEGGVDDLSRALAHRIHALILRDLDDLTGAFAAALEAESCATRHLRLTARGSPETQALKYAGTLGGGLDLALTILSESLHAAPAAAARSYDAVIRSRAVVLDEMARRHAASWAADAETAHLAETLALARRRLATLVLAGTDEERPETYPAMVALARHDKEEAERALAARSEAFRSEQAEALTGLREVQDAVGEGTMVVSYVRFNRISKTRPPAGGGQPVGGRGPAYFAFVLRGGAAAPAAVSLGAAGPIEELVERWRDEGGTEPSPLPEASARDVQDYREAGEALRKAIWDPVATHLGGAKRVVVVPDGALNLVSLAALPARDGRYLVETGLTIHYLSAERDLVRTNGRVRAGAGILAIGGPDYDADPSTLSAEASSWIARAREDNLASRPQVDGATPEDSGRRGKALPSGAASSETIAAAATPYRGSTSRCEWFHSLRFAPLPAARAEAEEIASLWRRSSKKAGAALELTGPRAGEEAFKRLSPDYRIVHVASHGFFVDDRCVSSVQAASARTGETGSAGQTVPTLFGGDNPLVLSGLALAGANHRSRIDPNSDFDDGILTAEEIASLDLSAVEWLVLSGCETGLGEIQSGEGVLGLRRALRIAGAGTVIMSLWRVGDDATRAWMRRLYQGSFSGLTTDEAVRRASLKVIKERRRAGLSDHPFYWGAFVAAGEWR